MKLEHHKLLNNGYKMIVFLLFTTVLIGCGKGKNEKAEIVDTYYSPELGWKMQIVKGWEKIDSNKVAEMTNKGISAIQSQTGIDSVDVSATKQLLNLQLSGNKTNKFLSNIEKWDFASEKEFTEHLNFLLGLVYDTFTGLKFNVEKIENPDVIIDGVKFKHITFKLSQNGYNLEENMYIAYHKGYLFTVTIVTTQESYKKEIEIAFLNSKFSK